MEQWPGDPTSCVDIDEPGDDLSKGPYFVETDESQPINLLSAALFNLIICQTTKMGLFVLSSAEGHNLDAIFAEPEKVSKTKDDEREKGLLAPRS